MLETNSLGPSFIGLSEQVALHGKFRPSDLAFVQEGHLLDWHTFNMRVDRIAGCLIDRGVQPGDRVAMLYGCDLEAIEMIFGIWRARAVCVPLSLMLPPELLAKLVIDCGATLLVSGAEHVFLAEQTAAAAGVVRVERTDRLYDQNLKEGARRVFVHPGPNDLANIIYSSGTTGDPKGIAHSHGARSGFLNSLSLPMGIKANSRMFMAIPVYSNGAMLSWGLAAYVGATTILMRRFDVGEFFDLVREWRPTHGFVVPTMCHAILAHADKETAGLDCFECALTAGAPMPLDMKREMSRLTGGGLAELWGLTESIATFISPDEMVARPGSVGRPAIGMDIRIINDAGEDVSFLAEGEIVGRSTSLMQGYWNRGDANKALVWLSPEGIPFIRTGDIGELDADGYLTLRGRSKDMLISGGVNVFPVDIEQQLVRHEAIADAAVIGISCEKWGETPVGFVILRPNAQADARELREWVNKRLASHQRLSDLRIWNGDFPRNALGKVLKRALRASL